MGKSSNRSNIRRKHAKEFGYPRRDTAISIDVDESGLKSAQENRIQLPHRRAGRSGSFARGFFAWNSEVGKTTLGAGFFLLDYVCCNRIIWGAWGQAGGLPCPRSAARVTD
jgi:hypothetical protein